MTFLTALYTLIISPLELFFEVVFVVANRIIGNEGLSIIFLSLAVNFLVLPLYKRADELQTEERDIQAIMAPHVKHIKKKFKGDERFFMLQEYYRINHYMPIYALKSSVSLLLQIPFFIAAYNLLSGMQSLQGMPFGFISDLGKEDAMFMIGSFPINVLPIAMTLINIVSGIIYTKGHPLKAKIQVYGLAAVFLVLLYHSPAGLVFYWLLNNVFSLVKNIFYKLKNPKKVLSIVLAIAGAVIFVLTVIRPDLDIRQKVLLSIGCVLMALPLVLSKVKIAQKAKAQPKDSITFFAGTIFLALFTGLFIPASVISSSTEEFFDVVNPINPINYIINSVLLSSGSFVLWGGVYYLLMNNKMKTLFSEGITIICGASILDYMVFGTNLGVLFSTLQYETKPYFSISEFLINMVVIALLAFIIYFVCTRFRLITNVALVVSILTVVSIGSLNTILVSNVFNKYIDTKPSSEMPTITLSTTGKNVVILMLDRAMGTQVPYILNEKPELLEQFDGFAYFPNTISFGGSTIVGAPALYGGYDYTPTKINERSTESLVSKHNEALKVLPEIFSNNDYKITICDPSFAGYQWIPDLSIYSDHPEFNCYITNGRFSIFEEGSDGEALIKTYERLNKLRNRNFFLFSLMKISPLIVQETIYDGGNYNESISIDIDNNTVFDSAVQNIYGLTKSTGYNCDFLQSYPVLSNLPNITIIEDSNENTFLMMSNDTTHSPCLLQEPDYIPSIRVDNSAYDINMEYRYTVNGVTMQMTDVDQRIHYHVNMAAFLQLGEWFDYLREQGVWDNTRIIIVSDHGRWLDQFDIDCNGRDMECFMPLLMVKDFDSTGFAVSEDFMTNADTPALATSGLIDNPVNPFTGNPIDSIEKEYPQTVFFCSEIDPEKNYGNTFISGQWYSVYGNPYNPDSWTYLGEG